MPELSVAELSEALGGTIVRGDPERRLSSYVIDSRRIRPGGVFLALKGTRTDGHRFLGEAARNGAAAAVIENEPEADAAAPPALIRVDDVVAGLARCGAWLRRHLSNKKWIAVTGSNGKTTTKEMLAAGLSTQYRVHRTSGNLNNHLGVPLTLLACPNDAEMVVAELAMSSDGEIAALTKITDPDVGLLTNVRAAHMEHFGTLDNIAAAKGELFAMMRDDATSVVNIDDPHVRVQATRHPGTRVTFGQHADADVRMQELTNAFVPGAAMSFTHEGKQRHLQLSMGGAHSAFNALAALAGVVAVGGDLDQASTAIGQLAPGPGRGEIHQLQRGILLVDDSYNSSPAALASVLETLRLSDPSGRRVLIMGDMLELGSIEAALHREAGKRAGAAGVKLLITVGNLTRESDESARRAGVAEVHHHKDSANAADAIAEFLKDGDLVVVKGSRSMHMEKIVRALSSSLRGSG